MLVLNGNHYQNRWLFVLINWLNYQEYSHNSQVLIVCANIINDDAIIRIQWNCRLNSFHPAQSNGLKSKVSDLSCYAHERYYRKTNFNDPNLAGRFKRTVILFKPWINIRPLDLIHYDWFETSDESQTVDSHFLRFRKLRFLLIRMVSALKIFSVCLNDFCWKCLYQMFWQQKWYWFSCKRIKFMGTT